MLGWADSSWGEGVVGGYELNYRVEIGVQKVSNCTSQADLLFKMYT